MAKPMQTYAIRTLLFMSGYVAVNAAILSGAFDDVSRPGAYVLALAVAAPVIGHMWATLDCMRQADEYVRARLARPFIVAAGATTALFTAWGYLDALATVPPVIGWAIYPLFWLVYGGTVPFTARTR